MVKIHQRNSPSHDLHVDLFNTYSINTALAAQAAIICNVSRSKNVRTWRWIWRHDWRIRTVWHCNRLTVMVTTCNHHVCTRLAGSGTYRRDFKGIKKVQIKPWSCACRVSTVESALDQQWRAMHLWHRNILDRFSPISSGVEGLGLRLRVDFVTLSLPSHGLHSSLGAPLRPQVA